MCTQTPLHGILMVKTTDVSDRRRCISERRRSGRVTKPKIKGKKLKMCKIWWWNPHLHSFVGDFCKNTSIGGLKFLTKRKVHISERLFWLISFLVGVAAAAYLINGIYERYQNIPVVVTFGSEEKRQYELPFPAFTICNMNKFPKREYEELERRHRNARQKSDSILEQNKTSDISLEEELLFAKTLCRIQQSFAQTFNYSSSRGKFSMHVNGTIHGQDKRSTLIRYMFNNTLQCDEIIRLCSWGSKIFNCSILFQRSATDFGSCCSFNMLPPELMFTSGRKNPLWTEEEMNGWRQWKYSENWAILEDYITFPRRQLKAGSSYGLSILVDPNINEYFCPVADSVGFRFVIHSPLERAQVFKKGAPLGVGAEMSIKIVPEVILADPTIKNFDRKKRKCVLGDEVTLNMFRPYTKDNCLDECIGDIIADNCSCIPYTSPSRKRVKMCIKQHDIRCIDKISHNLYELDQIEVHCGHCASLCENIFYKFHFTQAKIQDAAALWKNRSPELEIPKWAGHNMSIVHLYFNIDGTTPRLRTRLHGLTDLIANTGAILGLCLGVSVISIVETIYFFTLRISCIKIRRKTMGYRVANIFWVAFQKYKLKGTEKKNRHVTFIDI